MPLQIDAPSIVPQSHDGWPHDRWLPALSRGRIAESNQAERQHRFPPARKLASDPIDADRENLTEPSTVVDEENSGSAETAREAVEDTRTQRRRLAAVWLAAGSAVAAMVGVSWYVVVANGGNAPGGDMLGHAAAAEWLRTLPWWDWRGWSDWFYGGQAIGVN